MLIREVDEYDPKALVKPTASETLAAKWEAGKGMKREDGKIYIPGTQIQMTSIFEGQPPQNKAFSK